MIPTGFWGVYASGTGTLPQPVGGKRRATPTGPLMCALTPSRQNGRGSFEATAA
jgi:hypothetical protein